MSTINIVEDHLVDLGNKLRRGTTKEYTRSLHIARRTAELLRILISVSKKPGPRELIKEMKGTPLSMLGFNIEETVTEGTTPASPEDLERAMALVA